MNNMKLAEQKQNLNQTKSGLFLAIEDALKKDNEKERIIAVLDCIRGYKNQYDVTNEKQQYEGFVKCKTEFKNQIKKVRDYITHKTI